MDRSERQFKESMKLWKENPELLSAYAKALSDEFKKPKDEQRNANEVALECVRKERK